MAVKNRGGEVEKLFDKVELIKKDSKRGVQFTKDLLRFVIWRRGMRMVSSSPEQLEQATRDWKVIPYNADLHKALYAQAFPKAYDLLGFREDKHQGQLELNLG